jgi:hypothetical protein
MQLYNQVFWPIELMNKEFCALFSSLLNVVNQISAVFCQVFKLVEFTYNLGSWRDGFVHTADLFAGSGTPETFEIKPQASLSGPMASM